MDWMNHDILDVSALLYILIFIFLGQDTWVLLDGRTFNGQLGS